jgi:hypothetical protein
MGALVKAKITVGCQEVKIYMLLVTANWEKWEK